MELVRLTKQISAELKKLVIVTPKEIKALKPKRVRVYEDYGPDDWDYPDDWGDRN